VNRFLKFAALLSVILLGSWLLLHRKEIKNVADVVALAKKQLDQWQKVDPVGWTTVPSARPDGTIRIASFNLHNFGPAKAKRPHVLKLYAQIIQQFDLVALQEIRTQDTNTIASLIDTVNQGNGHYAIMTSPRIGRTHIKEQYAYIYDTRRVQPLGAPYVVADPDDLLHREPFVGWFRANGVDAKRGFTFALVDLHIDPDLVQEELRYLADIVRAVKNDGRYEDDVILLGDFNASDNDFTPALVGTGLTWLVRSTTTNTRSSEQYDNLMINPTATIEFTGRSGTFDFMRHYNLGLAQALEVSDHMPVWAEFSNEEGRSSGVVASVTDATPLR